MRSSALRITVLVWMTWWLGVFAPGHQRGRIVVPGTDDAPTMSAASCRQCVPSSNDSAPRRSDPAKHCAVCSVVAQMQDPPPIEFAPTVFERVVERTCLITSLTADSIDPPDRQRGRAPPFSL